MPFLLWDGCLSSFRRYILAYLLAQTRQQYPQIISQMVDEDTLRFCYGMLALVPLSFSFKFFNSPTSRYLYSTLAGLLLQLFVFGSLMLPIYFQHLIVYSIIRASPRRCGGLVTFEAMAFLSAYHIYEYVTNYGGWRMNAVSLLMILVCKYSLLAYDLQDGAAEAEKLSEQQRRNRIARDITFLEFMGYLNFLPTCLLGPPLEFNDYHNFVSQNEAYSAVPDVLPITIRTLAETGLFAALHLLGDMYIPVSALKSDQFYTHTIGYIFIYSTASIYLLRCKYYFAWKLSMSAVHAAGVSYDGCTFKRINTIDPWIFETSPHVREKINSWNIGVQEWLRKSIYLRSPLKSKTANQLYVFTVSAFWHGLYFAYYISQILWFVQLYLQTLVFKYFNGKETLASKIYKRSGRIGQFLLAAIVSLQFSHNSTYFVILEGEYCWKFMKSLYFVPELGLIALIVVFNLLPTKSKEKKTKLQSEQQEKGRLVNGKQTVGKKE